MSSSSCTTPGSAYATDAVPQPDHRASIDHRVRIPLQIVLLSETARALYRVANASCEGDARGCQTANLPCPDLEPASCLWSPPDAASAAAAGSGTPAKTTRRLHPLPCCRPQDQPLLLPPVPRCAVLDRCLTLTPVPDPPRRLGEQQRRPQLRPHQNPALRWPPYSAVRRRPSSVPHWRRGRRAPPHRRRLPLTNKRRRPPESPPSSARNAPGGAAVRVSGSGFRVKDVARRVQLTAGKG